MSLVRGKTYVSAVAVLLLALAVPGMAQVQTGTITGRAADASGALIPGVEVSVTSPAMIGGARTAPTGETGGYRFTLLSPGTYRVTFALPALSTLNMQDTNVASGATAT